MKVQPIAGTGKGNSTPTFDPRGAAEAKARAVQAFNQASPVTQPQGNEAVKNQNQIQPEEMGAIIPKSNVRPEYDKTSDNVSLQPDKISEDIQVVEETAPQKAPSEEDPSLRRQFIQLARQEKALRAKAQQQAQQFKVREEALAAKEAALAAKDQTYTQQYISKEELKRDALTKLQEAGVTYDELTQQILNQQNRDPRLDAQMSRLEAKIQELEAATQRANQASQAKEEDNYQAALKQISVDVRNLVKSDPVTYEAIAKTGRIKAVVDLIERTHKKDGIVLSAEEAAQEVENYLVDQGFKTFTRIDKIKKRLQQAGQPQKADVKSQATQRQSPMKTLTNATFRGELKS
jgi:hypothetical protein